MSMFRRQTEVSSTSESESSEYESSSSGQESSDDQHLRPPKQHGGRGTGIPLHRARTLDSQEDSCNNSNNADASHGSAGPEGVPSGRPQVDGASTEILFTSGELSSSAIGLSSGGDGMSTAAHRDMMMAGLLEHYYHSRALDFLVAANPGAAPGYYHRDSPEVRQLGGQLLAQATQRLAAGGVLDAATAAEDNADMRRQYLLGLDGIALPGVDVETLGSEDGQNVIFAGPTNTAAAAARDLVVPVRGMAAMNLGGEGISINANMRIPYIPHPANDLQLALRQQAVPPQQRSSHYRTSFEEVGFLGKGGFGSVFKCWNRFDDRMYAVKKIPLSPKLSKSFREGGHDRLGKLLREVRALATFDHANIVRYHATWIEEPGSSSLVDTTGIARGSGGFAPGQARRPGGRGRQVKLLEHHPRITTTSSSGGHEPSFSDGPAQNETSAGDDIVFGFDTGSGQATGPQWSDHPKSTNRIEELSSSEAQEEEEEEEASDIFTDGDANGHGAKSIIPTGIPLPDPTVHVLHIQMSLYPMTLAQYLSPTRPPTHCFHLLPSLRLLLSILTGLQYIHSKGMVHRDIKPGNIFLSPASVGDGSSTESSHSGYCNVGDCDSCYAASTSTDTSTTTTSSSSPPSSSPLTAPTAPNPVWLNPRIGDFGLVTQLAREGLSSPDALQQSLSGVFVDEMSSEKDDHLVGTMYYRPPRWPRSQPASPRRAARRDEKGGGSNSRKRHSMDEKLDIFALGVVLVEMLACCHTAMQRVDMLKAIQDGRVPVEDIRRCCAVKDRLCRPRQDDSRTQGASREVDEPEEQSSACKISDQVIALVEGMLALDPDERWGGRKVRTAVEGILADYASVKAGEI